MADTARDCPPEVRHREILNEQCRVEIPTLAGPLQELILEFDPQKMPEKIQSAETLVLERLQQLHHGNDIRVEKIALHDALSIIRIMKRDRRGSSGGPD